jgi:hypothetical protein
MIKLMRDFLRKYYRHTDFQQSVCLSWTREGTIGEARFMASEMLAEDACGWLHVENEAIVTQR